MERAMGFPKFDSQTFRSAMIGGLATLAVATSPAMAEDQAKSPIAQNFAATTTVATNLKPEQSYEIVTVMEAIERSEGQVVLYAGKDLQDVTAVSRFLNEQGTPNIILGVDPTDEFSINQDEMMVIANKRAVGPYTQDHINRGIAADIDLFAKSSGVPAIAANLPEDNMTAGL